METNNLRAETLRRTGVSTDKISTRVDIGTKMLMAGNYKKAEEALSPIVNAHHSKGLSEPIDSNYITRAIVRNISKEYGVKKSVVRRAVDLEEEVHNPITHYYHNACFCYGLIVGAQDNNQQTPNIIKNAAEISKHDFEDTGKFLATWGYLKESIQLLLDNREYTSKSHSLGHLLRDLKTPPRANQIFTPKNFGYSNSLEKLTE